VILQLLRGYDGCWNDDRQWWGLGFVRLGEYGLSGKSPRKYDRELLWGSQIFNETIRSSFTEYSCADGKSYWSTWWQLSAQDPHGENEATSFRNTITNSLLLELGLRLYDLVDLVPHPEDYELMTKDEYWDIALKLQAFLMRLWGYSSASGLMNDGGRCGMEGGSLTYTNGVILDAFARFAVIAYRRGMMDLYHQSLDVVKTIMTTMTLTPEENMVPAKNPGCVKSVNTLKCSGSGPVNPGHDRTCAELIPVAESGFCQCDDGSTVGYDCGHSDFTCTSACTRSTACKADLNQRVDCIGSAGGDSKTCLASPDPLCCYDSGGEVGAMGLPFCYKASATVPKNDRLVPVNGVSILTEGYGNCGSAGTSFDAFKGIFVRYLGYAIQTLEKFWFLHPQEKSSEWQRLAKKCKKFLQNNAAWVMANGKNEKTGRYAYCWQLTKAQAQLASENTQTSISTFSVVDLINSCTLLGL
jgi:hypothetical protein